MAYDAKLRVRVDPEAKAEAARILSEKGFAMSKFSRLAVLRLIEAKGFRFRSRKSRPRSRDLSSWSDGAGYLINRPRFAVVEKVA